MLDAAINIEISAVEIKEILYQAIPYVGMAKALDFFEITNQTLQSHDIKLPLKRQSTTTPATRQKKGLAVQKSIFGDVIDSMYQNAPAGQLHFQKLLSANCFGDYYTRTGLDLKTREVLTFVILISLGGVDAQAKAHAQGNLNVGNSKELLISIITVLLPYIGYPKALNALKSVNEVSLE